jgi:hypothetical protein
MQYGIRAKKSQVQDPDNTNYLKKYLRPNWCACNSILKFLVKVITNLQCYQQAALAVCDLSISSITSQIGRSSDLREADLMCHLQIDASMKHIGI